MAVLRSSVRAVLLACLVAGCITTGPTHSPAPQDSPAASASPTATRAAPSPSLAGRMTFAASCPPYEPAAPDPAAAGAIGETGPTRSMEPPPIEGERMVLQGVLLDWGCTPLPDTTFDIWHIDVRGFYGPGGGEGGGQGCCWYAASLTTDAEARFELHTIRPGTQIAPGGESIAHMHAAIQEEGPVNVDTTILFEGDEPLAGGGGARVVYATVERRRDEQGRYWWAFVVLKV